MALRRSPFGKTASMRQHVLFASWMAWLVLTSQVWAGRLSAGVLLHIFSILSTPQDVICCQATCKSWKSSAAWARPRRLSLACLWAWDHLGCWLNDHKALIQHVREVNFVFDGDVDLKLWDVVLLSGNRLESLTVEVSHASASFMAEVKDLAYDAPTS